MKRISASDFKKAEDKAFSEDLRIAETVNEFSSNEGEIEILEACEVLKLVKPRPKNSHKGSFGKLVFIGGSDRYQGAVLLASMAALRSGVGLLNVITTKSAASALMSYAREATVFPLESDRDGFIDISGRENDIKKIIKSADALLIGCGLGQGKDCAKILDIAINSAECPMIIDADGINLVSECIECLRKVKAEVVLTPHPGELARLVGKDVDYVRKNRFECAKSLHERTGAVICAKSSSTVICAKEGSYLSVRGNSGLARGGSGDLLAGLISSFAAQGYPVSDAVKIGVTVQGLACESATEKLSERGTLPSDILNELPELFKKIER